jgi:hypothetical protein
MSAIKTETVAGACDKGAGDREKTKGTEAAIYCGAALKPQLLSNQMREMQV